MCSLSTLALVYGFLSRAQHKEVNRASAVRLRLLYLFLRASGEDVSPPTGRDILLIRRYHNVSYTFRGASSNYDK